MTNMKLTEKQLAELFQTQSKEHTSTSDASDCLGATAASSNRISHVEDIANDHASAAAMRAAMSLKDWSQVMAQSIENTRQSWFSFLGMGSPLKTAFATLAFAFAFAIVLPEFSQFNQASIDRPMSQEITVQNDIINSLKFDEKTDQLQKMSFDGNGQQNDQLFNAGFG